MTDEKNKPKKKRKVNWKEYNESLVRRGEVMFDTDFLENWRAELRAMNRGKEGARYRYPNSLIWLLATVHAYLLPYRQLEGFLNMMSVHIERLEVPDYTTMQWRVSRMKVVLNPEVDPEKDVVIAIDSTGIKVANRGEWIHDKWWYKKPRKGFVKIHVAVDVKTKKILSKVTKENVADSTMLKPLVEEAPAHISKVIADGAYDTKSNFLFLDDNGIEPVIRVHKTASFKAHGCLPRKAAALEQLRRDVKLWKTRRGYGMRWMAESAFSCIKRTFGEYVKSVRWRNMVNELLLKASLYNTFLGMASA